MDEQFAIDVLSGRKKGLGPFVLRSACAIAEPAYAAAMRLRNLGFDHGWLPIRCVDVPVLSVGNLTTGGTGKTPVVGWLAERLQHNGFKPAVVSRGYRSFTDEANDERLVLEQLVPGISLIQNRDRFLGAQAAIRDFGCDVVLLDDGFQHRRLHRDLDLVLIDATQPFGFGRLLPRGLLREPMSSLRRADVVLVTRCDQASAGELQAIRNELARSRGTADCVEVRFAPRRLRNALGETRQLSLLAGERCLPFCGIGNPEAFHRTLAGFGVDVPPIAFPDHHHYRTADLERLSALAGSRNASLLVTTQKDLVKLPHREVDGRPLWAVEIAAEIVSGGELLEAGFAKLNLSPRQAA